MKMPIEIPAVAEMQRYAADFFAARKTDAEEPGEIAWVLHIGYEDLAPSDSRGLCKAVPAAYEYKQVSYLSAFVSPRGDCSKRMQMSLSDLSAPRFARCMSKADKKVVQLILTLKPTRNDGLFPVTQEMLEALCEHPNLYLNTLTQRRYYDYKGYSYGLVQRIENKATAIYLSQCAPLPVVEKGTLFVSARMPAYPKVPLIHRLGDGRYAVFRETRQSRRLTQFFKEMGIGGVLYLSVAHTELLERFLNLFGAAGGNGDFFRNYRSAKPTPFIRMEIRLHADDRARTTGGILRVLPIPDCENPPEPGKGGKKWKTGKDDKEFVERNFKQERALRAKILEACPTLASVLGKEENSWTLPIGATSLQIIEELSVCPPELVNVDWVWEKEKIAVKRKKFRLSLIEWGNSIIKKEKWVGLRIYAGDARKMNLFQEFFRRMRHQKKPYLQNQDGSYEMVSSLLALLSQLAQKSDTDAPADNAMLLKISRAGLLLLGMAQQNGEDEELQGLASLTEPILQDYQAPVSPPEGVQATLRPYQQEGFEWLQHLLNCGCGACLADDMGLGKTLQVLCVLQARAQEGASLVVAPSSVVSNWAAEAARFTPALNVLLPTHEKSFEEVLAAAGAGDVVIISYTLLQLRSKLLAEHTWNVAVLDEAQNIKNRTSARAKAAHKLQAAYRIAATGTPVENKMADLWSLFQFINPGLLGPYETFCRSRVSAEDRGHLVSTFLLRRTKKEVLQDLPDKKEEICRISLSDKEKELYECCRRELETMLLAKDWMKALLPGLQRLRRMCCHPLLGFPDCGLESSKLIKLRTMSQQLRREGHRTLVFSQFTDMLAFVKKMYDEEGVPYCYLDGSTPAAQRREIVERFQRGETDFFLISLKAGGTGLNLTAADTVIILDPWWNPAAEDQAADRAYRIGQQRNVQVYRYVCSNTVEERVMELKQHKRKLAADFMNGSDAEAGFTPEELRILLS